MSGGFDAAGWAEEIEARLRVLGTPERSEAERRYLKSDLRHLGVRVPDIRRVARQAARAAGVDGHDEAVALAAALWAAPVHERRMAAMEVLVHYRDRLTPADVPLLERLLRESRTWALVDPLAARVAGGLFERRSEKMAQVLDGWAADDDFWIRRSALLALLPGLRRGEGDFERFGRYADAMLEETEFFVRKAIGWVLRETAKRDPDRVARWLAPRTHRASGVTVREAVKPLPAELGAELLAAYRDRRPAG